MARFWGKKNYIRMQVQGMAGTWGSRFRAIKMRGDHAVWVGKLQPTPLSEEYEIEIDYKVGEFPNVRVLSPKLVPREPEGRIPHVYPGRRLCLFLPRAREWNRDMQISGSTIPWASLWLFHYEAWHQTGDWMGGGVHPEPPFEKKEQESNFEP